MATIVDSLVVELGLDPSQFTVGARQAVDKLNELEKANEQRSKGIASDNKRVAESLGGIKTQALELFAAFTGGKGIVSFVTDLTNADAAIGRVSRSTGIGATEISKWSGAARILGGDAASMASSFIKLSDAFAGWKVGAGNPQLMGDLRAISTAGGTPIDISKGVEQTQLDLAENLRAIHDDPLKGGPAMAGMLGRRVGLDPALLDLFIKGADATKKMLDYVNAMGPATDKSVDAAGELQRRWNAIFVRSEGAGRQAGVIPSILKAADFLNMTPGQAWEYLNRPDRMENPAPPKSLTPGFSATPTNTTPSGAMSDAETEAFVRQAAIQRGQNPDVWVKTWTGEGRRRYQGDPDATGAPTSFGPLQLHFAGVGRNTADGLGPIFQKQTGLDPRDPATARQQIEWSMDWAKTHGMGDWHGWKGAQFANLTGSNGPGGGGGGTTVQITGPITVTGVKDAVDFTNKLRDEGLRRQHAAAQAPSGGQ